MNYNYIPDITERFPEGYGGVDMTTSFYGEPVDYSRAYGYEPTYEELVADGEYENEEEIPYETTMESIFKVGQKYTKVGIYGGVTTYLVKEIDRNNNRIFLTKEWADVDGVGKRPGEWHKLETVDGKERFLEWTSTEFGNIWIYAYTTERGE